MKLWSYTCWVIEAGQHQMAGDVGRTRHVRDVQEATNLQLTAYFLLHMLKLMLPVKPREGHTRSNCDIVFNSRSILF